MNLKVITLWQPWATFISFGWKTIETRTHEKFKSLVGQPIGIHAGKKWDEYWLEASIAFLTPAAVQEIIRLKNNNMIPFGEIIATARVFDFRALDTSDSCAALIDCAPFPGPRYGLFLKDIHPLKIPIGVKGKQGVWNYPEQKA